MSRDKELKMKEIGQLVANLFCLNTVNNSSFLIEGKRTLLSSFGMNNKIINNNI